ncbi:hypothetical protein Bp8pC_037 [Bacillus phage Bp8p-C]|uniref:Uncharacterized protein n=2 Tax=Agatevirus Bp8pC TaxID=1910937 RepID=A0A0A0PJ30_9CAUD|nr:hypothetical protein AXJ20_gp037 [Bacillus phage Bp8p-C]YP_009784338.1 hypothetical protein QLX39_gp037 [Bacillus phage Bp8p-T]AHJ87468.1 hypothetical protein Bp8pC_037 [Bacillus phage Bp8p-C]AHJ87679.1 hypothetical protein Bp8pT_037 [Bacillus phage Bp8p-T]
MLQSREKLISRAEKNRRNKVSRIKRKLRKQALRTVEKQIKKTVRQGETYVHAYVDLNGLDKVAYSNFKHVLAVMKEVVAITESRGFRVIRHERSANMFDGHEYHIVIDLLKKPTKPMHRGET